MPEDHEGFDDDDYDDEDCEQEEAGHARAASGYPPPGFPPPPGRPAAGRGWIFIVTAVVAAAAAFGVVEVAVHDVPGRPAASATPRAGAPSTGTGGTQGSPPGAGLASLPPGAMEQLEIGGPVTAVSATSITIGSGSRAVTAAVTSATKVTGKVAGIGGIKVGDLVSASLTGTSGNLVADAIQDPASLPSGPGQ